MCRALDFTHLMYPYILMLGIKKQSLNNVASSLISLVGVSPSSFDMPQNTTFGCTFPFEPHVLSNIQLVLVIGFLILSLMMFAHFLFHSSFFSCIYMPFLRVFMSHLMEACTFLVFLPRGNSRSFDGMGNR